jgi:hypothetical protein
MDYRIPPRDSSVPLEYFADIKRKRVQVKRKTSWDTHGLPVELGTERRIGITKKILEKPYRRIQRSV